MANEVNIGNLDTLVMLRSVTKGRSADGSKTTVFEDFRQVYAQVERRVDEQVNTGNLEQGDFVQLTIYTALDCEKFGADGITVHPRPDERHIKRHDVYDLKKVLTTEFNIEGYPAPDFMELVTKIRPAQVTLVPDTPEQVTSNHGWNTMNYQDFLVDIISELKGASSRPLMKLGMLGNIFFQ